MTNSVTHPSRGVGMIDEFETHVMECECHGWPANGQADESKSPTVCHAMQYNETAVGPVAGQPTQEWMPDPGLNDFSYCDVFRDFTIQDQADIHAGYINQPRPGVPYPHGPDVLPPEEDWDYVVEVWPGAGDDDAESLRVLADHIFHVNAAFEKKNLDYQISWQDPISPEDFELFGRCRRYVLPRKYRHSERCRLQFLQVFNSDRPYNKALKDYHYKMSVTYESRNPLPTITSAHSTSDPVRKVTAFNHLNPNGDPTLIQSSSPSSSINSPAPTTPYNHESPPLAFDDGKVGAAAQKTIQSRMKPIPKPQRPVVKNNEGRFICTWPDCTSIAKEFIRKCEWSKHMDKHERPYKCLAEGCENVSGFTYSGGLLRHEREVHNKHGGPKNPLYCPHRGCKRHTDSSFARLENLNEHLRRCHTPNGLDLYTPVEELDNQPRESSRIPAPPPRVATPASETTSPRIGDKRKADDGQMHEEIKRLRFENQELKRKIEAGYLQQSAMMEQIDILEKDKAMLLRQQPPRDPAAIR